MHERARNRRPNLDVPRAERQSPAILLFGVGELPVGCERVPQRHRGARAGRVQAGLSAIFFDRLRQLALRFEQRPEVHVDAGEFGLQPQNFAVLVDGLGELLLCGISVGQVVVRLRVIRPDIERLPVGLDGLLPHLPV